MPARLTKVLCADDEEDILAIVQICLEMLPDLEIACCRDGATAIAEAHKFRPDLVVLDVMMPGMDGPTAMCAIKADPLLKDIPVILMTARVQATEIAQYFEMGAAGVIPKPFDPMTLADQILGLWRKAA